VTVDVTANVAVPPEQMDTELPLNTGIGLTVTIDVAGVEVHPFAVYVTV
jgi:hypothetical protein